MGSLPKRPTRNAVRVVEMFNNENGPLPATEIILLKVCVYDESAFFERFAPWVGLGILHATSRVSARVDWSRFIATFT